MRPLPGASPPPDPLLVCLHLLRRLHPQGGNTALMLASQNGLTEVVVRLLEGGADVAPAMEVAPASANPVRAARACCGPDARG